MCTLPTALLVLLLGCNRDDSKTGPGSFDLSEVEDPGQSLDSDSGEDDLDDTGTTDTGPTDTGPTDTGPTDSGEEEPAVDARTFGMIQVVATLVTDPGPFTDDVETGLTTSLVLARWERLGTDATWTETTCSVEQNEVFDTVTSFPDAFVETMPVHTRVGTLSAPETGATFFAGPFVDLVGVTLDDPSGDALPDDPDDSRVFDQDEDGEAGVTVHVDQAIMGEGDVYVVQRTTTTYEGVIVSGDRIEGYLDSAPEQSVLSASTWWLELDVPPPEPDPEPSHSYFVMQQMDDDATCADVIAQRGALFD